MAMDFIGLSVGMGYTDETVIGGAAVREQIGQLSSEIDTLNNGGLNLKEDFIGEQVSEWLDEHPEATTTVQNKSLTAEKFSDDLKLHTFKEYVTPEMFGAKGDGVTDDTQAFKSAIEYAISNKTSILIPCGHFIINNTLDITYPILIKGLGKETVVEYKGDSFLFNVSTNYQFKTEIGHIRFIGKDNSFVFCGNGRWGASINLHDLYISAFHTYLIQCESNYGSSFKNLTICSNGKIYFKPWSYEEDYNTTFSSNNYFENVYITPYEDKNTDKMFILDNVHGMTFVNCTFEKTDLLFDLKNKTRSVHISNSWLERIGNVCTTSNADEPTIDKTAQVNVDRWNQSKTDYDLYEKTDIVHYLELLTGASETYSEINSADEYVYELKSIYNPKGKTEYFPLYRSTTHRCEVRVPTNRLRNKAENAKNVSLDAESLAMFWENSGCLYEVMVSIYYDDTSQLIIKRPILKKNNTRYMMGIQEKMFSTEWEGAKAKTETGIVTISNGVVSFESAYTFKKAEIFVKFEPLGDTVL